MRASAANLAKCCRPSRPSDQTGAACPLVLGAEHHHRRLGRVRIRGDAVIEQELRGFFDLDVAGERSDHRLMYAPVSYTHLRAHETGRNLVCRLLLEKKK